MNKFNLSDWALEHRSLVWYFMIIFAVAGAYAYHGPRPRGGPVLHDQDDGDPGPVARARLPRK